MSIHDAVVLYGAFGITYAALGVCQIFLLFCGKEAFADAEQKKVFAELKVRLEEFTDVLPAWLVSLILAVLVIVTACSRALFWPYFFIKRITKKKGAGAA